ncbi:hypothetical protein GCM10022267_14640 [Lentzea roselyniae]|uniref:Trehalase-like N-terminal domain-containing protein n=1 Tax=Lentzea roselyniae TaxID=531940 RepID=A0ABP7ABX8_9PSEU
MTDFLTELPVRVAVPIERHSPLSDRRALALVTSDADVTWLCHPAPDSPALFAALLGGSGHFSIRPQKDQLPLGQRYVLVAMTVQTRWTGLQVTDHLSAGLVGTVEGRVPAVVEFAPRPDFGRAPVVLERIADALSLAGTPIVLRSPGVEWEIADGTATAVITPPFVMELDLGSPSEEDTDWLGWSAAAFRRARPGAKIRAHVARPLPPRHRRRPGRRHDVAARADRRRAQLGLPLLLAARRRW